MKDDVLKRIKDDYENKISSKLVVKRELEKLKSQIRIMQMHPAVCRFFELLEQYKDTEEVFYSLFDININLLMQTVDEYNRLGFLSETNKILFYIGSFYENCSKSSDNHSIKCSRCDSNAKYDLYMDIESLEGIKNLTKNRDCFENANHVIVTSDFPTERDFNEVRTSFLQACVEKNQEYAVTKLLSRK